MQTAPQWFLCKTLQKAMSREMKLLTIMLILSVPVINIGIHTAIRNSTAQAGGSFSGAFFSYGFLLAFSLGVLLTLCLLALYTSGITLSRAILYMAAISIIGGSLFGVLCLRETLNTVEWLIFVTLSALLLYRFFIIK